MQWHTSLGYCIKDGRIQVNKKGKKTVQRIFLEYKEGRSTTQIAASLRNDRIPNAQESSSWTHVAVGKILENSNYAGTGQYPELVTPAVFDEVQEKREQARAALGRGDYRPGARERELFCGVLVCGVCGAPYSRLQPRKNDQAKWKCKNYAYQKVSACAGGFLTDGQVMAICVRAINWALSDTNRIQMADMDGGTAFGKMRESEYRIENSREKTTEGIVQILRERAAESYRALKVRDMGQRTAEMYKALQGRKTLEAFDDGLYRQLIREIRVNRDRTVEVTFHNGSSVRQEYGGEELQEG